MALSVRDGSPVYQIDVVSAYLNDILGRRNIYGTTRVYKRSVKRNY